MGAPRGRTFGGMSCERGQASVEWVALLLLVALGLAALTRLAPSADGRPLATSLVRSVTAGARNVDRPHRSRPTSPRSRRAAALAMPRSPSRPARVRGQRAAGRPELPAGVRQARLPELPASVRRAGRGAGAVWRRAWFACLVYERFRYALAHPESRLPGYTIPTRVAVRMANNCVSPVDLLRSFPAADDGG
jgi:hypothetical protein